MSRNDTESLPNSNFKGNRSYSLKYTEYYKRKSAKNPDMFHNKPSSLVSTSLNICPMLSDSKAVFEFCKSGVHTKGNKLLKTGDKSGEKFHKNFLSTREVLLLSSNYFPYILVTNYMLPYRMK